MSTPPAWPPPPPPLPPGPAGAPPPQLAAPRPKTSSAVPIVIILIVVIFGGVFVLGIIAAIAIPGLLRARIGANEASAIGALRSMVSAEAVWASTHDGQFVLPSCLGRPAGCGDTEATSLLPPEIASLESRIGYDFGFVLRPSLDDAATAEGFAYWATPSTPGSTGLRRFCADETGSVREYDMDDPWSPPTADVPRCPENGRHLR